jgi:hypothetical protein
MNNLISWMEDESYDGVDIFFQTISSVELEAS